MGLDTSSFIHILSFSSTQPKQRWKAIKAVRETELPTSVTEPSSCTEKIDSLSLDYYASIAHSSSGTSSACEHKNYLTGNHTQENMFSQLTNTADLFKSLSHLCVSAPLHHLSLLFLCWWVKTPRQCTSTGLAKFPSAAGIKYTQQLTPGKFLLALISRDE